MEKWEDPSIFAENVMPPHAPFREETVSLNGRWRFLCQRASEPLPEGFWESGFSARKWDRIDVPACWESRNYGQAFYCGTTLSPALSAKAKRIPQIDPGKTYTGIYRRSFKIPGDWDGKQILLRFSGVSSCIQVWINGACLGMSKGNHTPIEFDITQSVTLGKNSICVQVHQYSDATYAEPKNRWLLSGLTGDVELYALPSRRIVDLRADACYDESFASAELGVTLSTRNADGLTARIAVMDGNTVAYYGEGIVEQDTVQALIPCNQFIPWTAETPHLYRIAVILWDGVGIYHTRQIPYGFRRISIADRVLKLNGTPIKLQGVVYGSDCGPLTEERIRQDLCTMKRHNLNAIRVSAGSLPEKFYDLCDEYGIYLLEDGITAPLPLWNGLAADQAQRIVRRHGLHPSVILWGNGVSKELDDSRPTGEDFFCAELLSLEQMRNQEIIPGKPSKVQMLRSNSPTISDRDSANLPLLATYGLLRGNDTVPYSEYHDHFQRHGQWMGGFLSNFTDPALPWVPEAPQFSGLVHASGNPHQVLGAVQKAFQPIRCTRLEDGTIEIENLHSFTDTSDYSCSYALTQDGKTLESAEIPIHAAPGTTQRITIKPKSDIYKPGRYHLALRFALKKDTPWAPAGTVMAWDQWELANLRHIRDENPGGTIREENGRLLLRAGEVSYTISRVSGNLEQIELNGKPLLISPLSPVFCRARTEAEPTSRQAEEWSRLTLKKKLPKPSIVEVDHMTRTVTVTQKVGSGLMRSYRLFADGSMNVELRLRTGKTAPNCIGMSCALAPSAEDFRWFGKGPWDSYPDRDIGWFGLHRQSVPQQDEYPIAQEHGRKQVYSMTLTDSNGFGLEVLADEGIFSSVWPYTLEELVDGKLPETRKVTTLNLECCQNGLRSVEIHPHTTYIYNFTIRPIL